MNSRARTPTLAAGACAAAFATVLALAYGVPAVGSADANALHGMEQIGGPRLHSILSLLTNSADPLPLIALLAAIVAAGVAVGRRRQAIAAPLMVGAAVATSEVLKVALAHPRYHAVLAHQVGTAAFPSGHATAAMALALAAVLVAPARWRPAAMAGGAAYAIGVCTSLLVLGWHLPSDVFGGMLVASLWFCLAVAALRLRDARLAAGAERGPRRAAFAHWRAAGLAVAAVAAGVAIGRADAIAAFAHEYTTATAVAFGVIACSAALLVGAAHIADR